MDPDALAAAIAADRAAGRLPLAVVATAGTTSTTSVDPVPAIADLCERGRRLAARRRRLCRRGRHLPRAARPARRLRARRLASWSTRTSGCSRPVDCSRPLHCAARAPLARRLLAGARVPAHRRAGVDQPHGLRRPARPPLPRAQALDGDPLPSALEGLRERIREHCALARELRRLDRGRARLRARRAGAVLGRLLPRRGPGGRRARPIQRAAARRGQRPRARSSSPTPCSTGATSCGSRSATCGTTRGHVERAWELSAPLRRLESAIARRRRGARRGSATRRGPVRRAGARGWGRSAPPAVPQRAAAISTVSRGSGSSSAVVAAKTCVCQSIASPAAEHDVGADEIAFEASPRAPVSSRASRPAPATRSSPGVDAAARRSPQSRQEVRLADQRQPVAVEDEERHVVTPPVPSAPDDALEVDGRSPRRRARGARAAPNRSEPAQGRVRRRTLETLQDRRPCRPCPGRRGRRRRSEHGRALGRGDRDADGVVEAGRRGPRTHRGRWRRRPRRGACRTPVSASERARPFPCRSRSAGGSPAPCGPSGRRGRRRGRGGRPLELGERGGLVGGRAVVVREREHLVLHRARRRCRGRSRSRPASSTARGSSSRPWLPT